MEENTKKRFILHGMQILSQGKWLTKNALIVEDNLIQGIITIEQIKNHLPAEEIKFPENYYLIPGLIDLHVHGAQNADVMDGTKEALETISQSLAAEGITGFLATTMTADDKRIEKGIKNISEHKDTLTGAAILGIHLEGPFIAKEKVGAQNADYVKDPDWDLFRNWQSLAENGIRLVTLAPELPEAISFINNLQKSRVIAAIGHTNATYAQAFAGIEAGCNYATHLFNAMSGIRQREPGTVGAILLANNVFAELIVDGIHLVPPIVDLAFKIKGKDKIVLVSDAMRAKCLGNGKYELGGQEVHVKDGKASLADGTLAGSTLRLPEAIKNLVAFTHCELPEAISMASLIPARILGLSDQMGAIEVGMLANIAVMDNDFEAVFTMREGGVVYRGV